MMGVVIKMKIKIRINKEINTMRSKKLCTKAQQTHTRKHTQTYSDTNAKRQRSKDARSVGSRTTESVRATRTQDGTDAIHGCCAMLFSFCWTQNGYPGRAVITCLVSMRSVCAVSRPVIRCVLRVLRSPEHTITTNALHVSDTAGNVSSTNPKEKLGLEQRSGATDCRSKGYRVSTCSFPTDIRFRS